MPITSCQKTGPYISTAVRSKDPWTMSYQPCLVPLAYTYRYWPVTLGSWCNLYTHVRRFVICKHTFLSIYAASSNLHACLKHHILSQHKASWDLTIYQVLHILFFLFLCLCMYMYDLRNRWTEEMKCGNESSVFSNPSGYSVEVEHPDPETDEADAIPDWWCHPCEALPVLCLSVALQSAAAGTQTHKHTHTCLWHSAFVIQVVTLLMPERAAFFLGC